MQLEVATRAARSRRVQFEVVRGHDLARIGMNRYDASRELRGSSGFGRWQTFTVRCSEHTAVSSPESSPTVRTTEQSSAWTIVNLWCVAASRIGRHVR